MCRKIYRGGVLPEESQDDPLQEISASDSTEDPIDSQSMDDSLQTSPIESIIAKDSAGKEQFYTTLLDSKNRIVDTTDPDLEKDSYYKSKEEGGEAGTVDLNAKLKVRFRMAEIAEHNGDNGVQENVLYYMTLPDELVPVKKDNAGKVLVDPDTPVDFFQSGELQCSGGIYSAEDKYQLQLRFSNVEDQLNIAGEFQYDVTLSDQLEEGTKCTISYVPGGTLEFNITPGKEEPVEDDESLSLTSQKNPDATDKIDWTLTLTDRDMKLSAKRLTVKFGKGSGINSGPMGSYDSDILGLSSVEITYKDGHTETLKTFRINSTAYALYREGVIEDPSATDIKDAGHGIIGTIYTDTTDYKSEGTIIESGYNGGKFLTDTLYIDMTALKSNGSNQGNNRGFADPADIDLEISKYEFKFTSQVYDDYNISDNYYTASASMTDAKEEKTLATASAGTSITYNMPQGGLLDDAVSSEKNYFGIPSYIQTTYVADNYSYTGNHYSLEFAPQQIYYGRDNFEYENSTNAIYYTSYRGFFESSMNITGGWEPAFEQLEIGDADAWTFCTPLSYRDIQSGANGRITSYIDSNDLPLVYQIKKVFENMEESDSVLLYKSKTQVNGKYVYLIVDPDTRNNAYYSYANNGWSRLARKSSDGSDARASNWKIHIFNAPAQSVKISFKQSNGTAYAKDQGTGGSAVDSMVASYNVYGDTSDSGCSAVWDSYHIEQPAASVMTGRWVSDDTIFWEMTAYAENINEWRQSTIYIRVPVGQELLLGEQSVWNPIVDIDGKMANTVCIQYYNQGAWNIFGGSKRLYTDETGVPLTKDINAPSITKVNGYDNIYRVDYGSIPTYDSSHIKIGFATRVTDLGDRISALKCQAEIVTMNGETTKFGSSGSSRYPFKVSAEGQIGNPQVYKIHTDSGHTDADADGVEHITDTWNIYAETIGSSYNNVFNELLDSTYTGFYSGVWSLHDDMKDSYTQDEKESEIDVNPAKYTTLKDMTVTVSGPGMSGKMFELSENDLKEVAAAENYKKVFTSPVNDNVKLTLTYQGNMYDGFDVQISGIKDIQDLNVIYTTDFNQKDFFEGVKKSGADVNQFYTAVFCNNAHRGSQTDINYPADNETVKHRVVAALDINKAVTDTSKKNEEQGGYSATYKLDAQIGYSSSAYVDMEDFVLGYTEKEDNASYQESDVEAMKALVKSLQLSDLTVTATDVNNKEQQIYSGKEESGNWTGTVEDENWNVSFEYKPDTDHPGSLFKIRIKKADGSDVSADYKFTVNYRMTVCMDEAEDDFRDSEYYNGGELRITNGGEAVRTVKQLSDTPDTQTVKNRAAKHEDLTLSADCGSGVTVSYLADKLVNKTAVPTSDPDVTKWMIYDWTGTKGKNHITGSLTDALYYLIDDFSYIDKTTGKKVTLDQLDDQAKEEITSKIAGLLYKYTTFKNIKLYYTENKPKDDLSNLTDTDLLYAFEHSFNGQDDEQTYEERVTDKNGELHVIKLTTGKSKAGQSAAFEATADNLKNNAYFVTTYETEINWEKVYEEIGDLYPQCSVKSSYKNTAHNDAGAEKESVGSHVEVMDENVEKNLISSDVSNGTSSWQIKAFTGPNKSGELTLADEVTVNAENDGIKSAVENAIFIDPDSIVIKYGDTIVYQNQKVENGWQEENLSVQVEGRKLNVVIKNTDKKKVIFANSTYRVCYNTVLDKDAYIVNGGKAGDEAKLQNAVMMKHGSFSGSADQKDEFKPEIPVDAEKSYLGNGSEGQDKTTVLWQAVAKTGDAGRKNFVLKDSVSCAQEDKKVQKALKLQDVVIKVQTGQEEERVYTTDNLPDGVTFTEEGAGFTLSFNDIPKDTTVTVDYAVHFDKDVYQEAGGDSDVKVDLNNAFKISSDDGYTASDDASGSIEYGKGFTKEGMISSKKMQNGNPIIEWKIKVNLFDLYTAEEISGMSEATITDSLSAVLRVIDGSVKLTDLDGKDISQDVYNIIQNGNVLKATLTDLKTYPIFNLEFKTECGASVNGLVNDASLSVNGKKVEDTSSEDVGKLEAADQYGWIQSMKVPEFTPVAYKYLDHELCTEKGLFQFSIEQVDADGHPIENGYQDTAFNDENGQITFKKITYRDKPVEGSYYYQIRETSEVEPYTYTIDERVFTIRVDVIASKGQYLVAYTVTDPENYDEVRFDNATITTRDFTVTKKWNDDGDKAGARPKSITVYLLNHGKRYNNMSVTLNEENNWTYTWKNLPMADGDYSVEEADVDNYTADVETEDWNSVITNTYKPETPKDTETPQNGEKPKDIQKPQNSETSKKEETLQNNVSNTPRTGDVSGQIGLWVILMFAALGAGIIAFRSRKNR